MDIIAKILNDYKGVNVGVRANLYRMLMHGALAGTGKMIILPVDQGFEHGPGKSFAANPLGYDPSYHVELAIEAGLSAFAAPYGFLEAVIDDYAGRIPVIMKMNSSNLLNPEEVEPDQAIYASIDNALELGCAAVGFTVYPGSACYHDMLRDIAPMIKEAKSKGLAVVIWSYPRGMHLNKAAQTAIDVVAYAAHMACLIGADVVKVKPPSDYIYDKKEEECYSEGANNMASRIQYIKRACLAGRRLVVFSGGAGKSDIDVTDEVTAIKEGGGNGSIIGRNVFQRKRDEALVMLSKMITIYRV